MTFFCLKCVFVKSNWNLIIEVTDEIMATLETGKNVVYLYVLTDSWKLVCKNFKKAWKIKIFRNFCLTCVSLQFNCEVTDEVRDEIAATLERRNVVYLHST